MKLQTGLLLLSVVIIAFSACVTERVDQSYDGEEYLKNEIEKVIVRLPLDSGMDLVRDLTKLVSFGPYAIEPMIECLNHEVPQVRSSAIYVLGQLKAEQALDQLMELCNDDNKLVRYEAARAVFEIGSWETFPIILAGLDDDQTYIRYLCMETISFKSGETFGYDPRAPREERLKSIEKWELWWDAQKDSKLKEQDSMAAK